MVYVWEAPIRIYHWVNVILIVVLLVTGFYIGKPILTTTDPGGVHFLMARVRLWHMLAAWLFISNYIFRFYWAFKGNEHAKFKPWRSGFVKDGIDTLKYYLFLKKEHTLHTGHNVIAQLTYFLVMWVGSVLIIFTGLAMQGETNPGGFQDKIAGWFIVWLGSYTVRMFHHLLAWLFVVFIVAHLYLIFRQELLDDDGTVSSIFSGYKFVITQPEGRSEVSVTEPSAHETG